MLPKITATLNTFFNKQYSVIYSIYTMFNSVKDTEAESSKANAEQFTPHLPKPIVDANSFQKVEPSVSQ